MNIMIHLDRRAAILAGHDVGSTMYLEVSPETIGTELWPFLVQNLDVDPTVPVLNPSIKVPAPTLQALRETLAAAQQVPLVELHKVSEAIREWAKKPLENTSLPVPKGIEGVEKYDTYDGFATDISVSPMDVLSSVKTAEEAGFYGEAKAVLEEWQAVRDARTEAVEKANETALAEALPRLRHNARQAERERAERTAAVERERAEQAAAVEARKATRRATGYWIRETCGYSERSYGMPWVARVTGVDSRGKLIYEFGEWSGRPGDSGLLRVYCVPGEIIAWGQKDIRKPSRSDHHILVMEQDGGMREITVVEAVKIFRGK